MKKKGAAEDLLLITSLLFVIAISFFIFSNVATRVADIAINNTQINSSSAATAAFQNMKTLNERLDGVVFAFYIAFVLAVMVSSWFVDSNPIFLVLFMILLIS